MAANDKQDRPLGAATTGVVAAVGSLALVATSCGFGALPSSARGVQPVHVQGLPRAASGGQGTGSGSEQGSARPADERTAVIGAWRASQRAFESATASADPTAPGLEATTMPPEQSVMQQAIAEMQAAGERGRGPVDLGQPSIVATTPTEATVRACIHDAEVVVDDSTDKPVPGILGRVADELVVSLMMLQNGVWKLADESVRTDACVAP